MVDIGTIINVMCMLKENTWTMLACHLEDEFENHLFV